MLKFSEILNFLGKIPILKEFEWSEWFEWFGPSPIEPFNSAGGQRRGSRGVPRFSSARLPGGPEGERWSVGTYAGSDFPFFPFLFLLSKKAFEREKNR